MELRKGGVSGGRGAEEGRGEGRGKEGGRRGGREERRGSDDVLKPSYEKPLTSSKAGPKNACLVSSKGVSEKKNVNTKARLQQFHPQQASKKPGPLGKGGNALSALQALARDVLGTHNSRSSR